LLCLHTGIRWGTFYSNRLIEYLGLAAQDGVVRVSLVHYNTLEEVDRLIQVLRTVLADLPTPPPDGVAAGTARGGYH
jgi:selenocysteine lyase/cysteine desulfurase